MRVTDFLRPDGIVAELDACTQTDALVELARVTSLRRGADPTWALDAWFWSPKVIAASVAVAYRPRETAASFELALGRSTAGIKLESFEGASAHILLMLAAPARRWAEQLAAMARLARVFREESVWHRLLAAPTSEAMYGLIVDEDARN